MGILDNKYVQTVAGPLGGAFLPNNSYDPRITPLDPGTLDLLDKKSSQASQSEQDVANNSMANVGDGKGFLSTPDQMAHQQYSLGQNGDGALNAAINNKAQKYYNANLTDIGRQAQFQAPLSKANNLNATDAVLSQQQQMTNAQDQINYHAQQNKMAMRNAAISSLFSMAGTAVGAIFGGPAGAAVGSKVGGAVGGAAANQTGNYQSVGDSNSSDYNNYA